MEAQLAYKAKRVNMLFSTKEEAEAEDFKWLLHDELGWTSPFAYEIAKIVSKHLPAIKTFIVENN